MAGEGDGADEPLFDASLIPREAVDRLAKRGIALRPLKASDYHRGHYELLRDLVDSPDLGEKAYVERFHKLRRTPDTYYILVAVDTKTDQLVAQGSAIVDHKFILSHLSVANLEEIVVRKSLQGTGLGKAIVQATTYTAYNAGVRKCVLHCSEANKPFYKGCGYNDSSYAMQQFMKDSAPPPI